MAYLQETYFRNTAYATEVSENLEVYRVGVARESWDYPEMTRTYLRGHQVETFTVSTDGDLDLGECFSLGTWERKEMWAIVEVDGSTELAPFRMDVENPDFSTFEDDPEYTHAVVAAVEYGDGWINLNSGVDLSLEQLFKERDEHLVRSGRVIGVDGLKIAEAS